MQKAIGAGFSRANCHAVILAPCISSAMQSDELAITLFLVGLTTLKILLPDNSLKRMFLAETTSYGFSLSFIVRSKAVVLNRAV